MLIRRYQAKDNKEVKALHHAGLAQFGAATDPYHDKDLEDIEGVYINNNGEFLVGTLGSEIVAMGAIRNVSGTRRRDKAYQSQAGLPATRLRIDGLIKAHRDSRGTGIYGAVSRCHGR
jgi:hypothetical protein